MAGGVEVSRDSQERTLECSSLIERTGSRSEMPLASHVSPSLDSAFPFFMGTSPTDTGEKVLALGLILPLSGGDMRISGIPEPERRRWRARVLKAELERPKRLVSNQNTSRPWCVSSSAGMTSFHERWSGRGGLDGNRSARHHGHCFSRPGGWKSRRGKGTQRDATSQPFLLPRARS